MLRGSLIGAKWDLKVPVAMLVMTDEWMLLREWSMVYFLDEHLGDAHDAAGPVIAAAGVAAVAAAEAVKGAVEAAVGRAAGRAGMGSGTTASHAHGVADEAKGVARGGARGHAQGALEGGRHAQAEAGEQGCEGASGDEGHDDHEEDLPGVALEPMYEVADEALELLVGALHEALARGALVVRGTAACEEVDVSKRAGCVQAMRQMRRRLGSGHFHQRRIHVPKPKKLLREEFPRGMPKKEPREVLCLL